MKPDTSYIENQYVQVGLRDEIVYTEYKQNLIINMEVARRYIVEERLKISNGITRPFLADIRNLKSVDNDARDYLASDEACQFISAIAIVTGNRIQQLFANFYLIFSQPTIPTKLFTNKEKGLQWLRQYKN